MNLLEYAALSHEGTDWTEAFAKAMEDIRAQGGGVLTVPAGDYPTGSIRLCSNLTLEVQKGATLRFHQREDAFPLIPLEFEGNAGLVHQPCVYAQGEEHVKITGDGVLDGQGEYWWRQVWDKTGPAHPRPHLICFADCNHVVLEHVVLLNSPVWTVHPLRCRNVVIRGVFIKNPANSPNTDGIDPNCCEDVRIHGCTIDVGDDCIAIKSGTEKTPNRRPTERVLISGCHFLHGHGGVVLGSEMSGDIRDVMVSDCVFRETDRGVRLKTRRGRGGAVEGIDLNNLSMFDVMCPFVFNMYYFCGSDGKLKRVWDKAPYPVDEGTPCLRNVRISGVRAKGCTACAGFFYGLAEMPVKDVTLQNIEIEMATKGPAGRPAMMDNCPEMQGAGFFLRNAVGVKMKHVQVQALAGELLNIDESVSMEE